jgi:hypothetical protein
METFKKRQKEMQRLERQRDKAARRVERKQIRANGGDPLAEPEEPTENGEAAVAVEGENAPVEPPVAQQ